MFGVSRKSPLRSTDTRSIATLQNPSLFTSNLPPQRIAPRRQGLRYKRWMDGISLKAAFECMVDVKPPEGSLTNAQAERIMRRYGLRPMTAAEKRRFAGFLRTRSKNGK